MPSWQLQSKPVESKEAKLSPLESLSRETVIEQAKKFLEEDEVRNASTDKKITFLESKGLRSEEIQGLLGVTRNPEATGSPSQVSSPSPPEGTAIANTFVDFISSSSTLGTLSYSFSNLTILTHLSTSPRHSAHNNLPRIPHHPTTTHTSCHQIPPPNNTLPLRRTLRPSLWHK